MVQGLAIGASVLGGLFGIGGARKRAKAVKKATNLAIDRTNAYASEYTDKATELAGQLRSAISGINVDVEGMKSFVYGGENSLQNLRKAQTEFSGMAAGDFSNFNREVQAISQGTLANTYGMPTGSFANLSAKNLMNFRTQGLNNALNISNQFLDTEYRFQNIATHAAIERAKLSVRALEGGFDRDVRIAENQLNAINQLEMMRAGQQGSTLSAIGAGLGTLGQAGMSFMNLQNTLADSAMQRSVMENAMLNNFSSSNLGASSMGVTQRPSDVQYTGFSTQSPAGSFDSYVPAIAQDPLPVNRDYGSVMNFPEELYTLNAEDLRVGSRGSEIPLQTDWSYALQNPYSSPVNTAQSYSGIYDRAFQSEGTRPLLPPLGSL